MSAAPIQLLPTPATSAAPENLQAPAAGMRHIATLVAPFDSTGLTPVQASIAAALASGTTIVRAALDAGVHRATIHKWLQTSKAFCDAVKSARDHYDSLIADQLNELSALALDNLRQLLTNPDTPAPIRLRASLAVLGRPTPPAPGWHLPKTCGLIAIRHHAPEEPANHAASRNAPCPCGSGLKHKRCCGSLAKALSADAA
jgi:hypothetical protein